MSVTRVPTTTSTFSGRRKMFITEDWRPPGRYLTRSKNKDRERSAVGRRRAQDIHHGKLETSRGGARSTIGYTRKKKQEKKERKKSSTISGGSDRRHTKEFHSGRQEEIPARRSVIRNRRKEQRTKASAVNKGGWRTTLTQNRVPELRRRGTRTAFDACVHQRGLVVGTKKQWRQNGYECQKRIVVVPYPPFHPHVQKWRTSHPSGGGGGVSVS